MNTNQTTHLSESNHDLLVDALRMEEFVVGLARRGACAGPEDPPGPGPGDGP